MIIEEIPYKFVYTDLAVKNLQRDLKIMKRAPFKINEPYIQSLEKVISIAINERRKLKQVMYKHKVRVELVGKQNDITIYHFYRYGKFKEVRFNKHVLKSRVKEKMLSLK